ncbi:hypothetical protein [Helicobacter suis]|uniref:hypothetical protein n=1 Tax=Helicobacter suis TaxID=104628 RepID=UPI0013D71C79|nr:hypothetical protein [Helicobacter suis]
MPVDYNLCNERQLFKYLNTTEKQLSKTQVEYRQLTKKLQELHNKRDQIRSALSAKFHVPNQETQLAMMNAHDPKETYIETQSFNEFAQEAEKED